MIFLIINKKRFLIFCAFISISLPAIAGKVAPAWWNSAEWSDNYDSKKNVDNIDWDAVKKDACVRALAAAEVVKIAHEAILKADISTETGKTIIMNNCRGLFVFALCSMGKEALTYYSDVLVNKDSWNKITGRNTNVKFADFVDSNSKNQEIKKRATAIAYFRGGITNALNTFTNKNLITDTKDIDTKLESMKEVKK